MKLYKYHNENRMSSYNAHQRASHPWRPTLTMVICHTGTVIYDVPDNKSQSESTLTSTVQYSRSAKTYY